MKSLDPSPELLFEAVVDLVAFVEEEVESDGDIIMEESCLLRRRMGGRPIGWAGE